MLVEIVAVLHWRRFPAQRLDYIQERRRQGEHVPAPVALSVTVDHIGQGETDTRH